MDAENLTDRYVAAAMRTVPQRQRDDVGAELRASIADQIDARVEAGEAAADAEVAVLTDLGDPDRLAADYTDRPLQLIGPQYYLAWSRLLKLLLWIVVPCAGVGVALGMTLSGATIGAIAGTTALVIFHTVVQLAFWVTVVFAFIQRSGDPAAELAPWSLDQLPEVRPSGIGRTDMIASLVLLAAFAGAVLWDRLVGFVPGHQGLSILNESLWPTATMVLLAVLAVEAVIAVAVYAVGRWTWPLVAANAVLNLVIAAGSVWLLLQDRFFNPQFWPTLIDDAASAHTVAGVVAVVTGFGIVGVAVWDIIDTVLKARRRR